MTKLFTHTDLHQDMIDGPLGCIVPVYAAFLAKQGYAENSAHLQLRFLNDLNQWLLQQQLLASGNLMVFVAFNFTISDDLPRLGYLTLLDRLIVTSFACAALVVFISVYQKRLEAKGKKGLAARIDNLVLIFYPLIYLFLVCFECFVEIKRVAV